MNLKIGLDMKKMLLFLLLSSTIHCAIPTEPCIIYKSFSLDKTPAEVFLVLTKEDEFSNSIRSFRVNWVLSGLTRSSIPLDWIRQDYYNEAGDLIIEWSVKARMVFRHNMRSQVWERECIKRGEQN